MNVGDITEGLTRWWMGSSVCVLEVAGGRCPDVFRFSRDFESVDTSDGGGTGNDSRAPSALRRLVLRGSESIGSFSGFARVAFPRLKYSKLARIAASSSKRSSDGPNG